MMKLKLQKVQIWSSFFFASHTARSRFSAAGEDEREGGGELSAPLPFLVASMQCKKGKARGEEKREIALASVGLSGQQREREQDKRKKILREKRGKGLFSLAWTPRIWSTN